MVTQWDVSRLVGQQTWSMTWLTRLTCSLRCKSSGCHEMMDQHLFSTRLGWKKKQILTLVLIFSQVSQNPSPVQFDYAVRFHPVCTISAYPAYFINRINRKIYTIFRRVSAINLIYLLRHSWEIKDWDNQWSSQEFMNQKKSWEKSVSVSGCT